MSVDGNEIDFKQHGLADIEVLNIPSFSGGCDMWHTAKDGLAALNVTDGLIEVIGIESSFHVAQCKSGLSHGIRLAQGRRVTMVTSQRCPLQIDGEAWMQDPCQVDISCLGQSALLVCAGAQVLNSSVAQEKQP